MEMQMFDLSGGTMNRHQRMLWALLGVFQFINGFFAVGRGDLLLGWLMIAFGAVFVFASLLTRRLDQYTIALDDEQLAIRKRLFVRHQIPWTSIAEIRMSLMRMEVITIHGEDVGIDFGQMSYIVNQTVKPEVVNAIRSLADEKGIRISESN